MKYTDQFLKDYDIELSFIKNTSFKPELIIRCDNIEEQYTLSANSIQDISHNNLYIIEYYIDKFIYNNIQLIRNKKLKKLNEVQT